MSTKPNDSDKLPTNPLKFPDNVCPKFILKAKNGQYMFLMEEPSKAKGFLWYMSETKQVSLHGLEEEMRVPGRRWYATDKPGFEAQRKTGASTTEGEPYVCLRNIKNPGVYWCGRRHVEPPAGPLTLVLTVAELYLKSALHQQRFYRLLCEHIRRVLKNPRVHRCGNNMIEVREQRPTAEQLDLLALLPGIGKMYEGDQKREGGDPRGPFIRDGAGGMPLLPDQHALALISGGIDSPVAAYQMMTRGCTVSGIHFLNSTNDTAAVLGKNRQIGEILSRIQGRFDMHYVDISKLQSQIVANVPNHNRTLIYKWFMLALGACFDESHFIVVGDSAGQVASQTVPNISTLYSTISKAVIAPLIGMSKNSIIDIARRIDTYRLSIQEGADCCQYMMCKTGANLNIGRNTVEACVRRIVLSELPVIHEVYRDGALAETEHTTFMPNIALRRLVDSTRRARRAAERGGAEAADTAEAPEAAERRRAEEDDVVYFDAAAGTKMTESVKDALLRAPEGNPNSMHLSGREARMAVERVRMEVATALGVPAKDIIFTAGGTESNNIALHGYRVVREAWSHASTSEGAAVGADAEVVHVVDLVNHETGSVAPVLRRPAGCRLHVDASQALMKVDLRRYDMSQVDSLTVTAHKINGPIGVGAVYLRDLQCHRLFSGGSQEKGIRPGTENVPAIVGFGAALRINRSHSIHREVEALVAKELAALGCEINRRGETSGYIVHATLPEGYDNTEFVSRLSTRYKVEIGTGSACKTGEQNTTVYDTLGKAAHPSRSIRVSWDSFVTMNDALRAVEAIKRVAEEQRPKK
ncbi:thiamine biosynthesis-like protein [Strigomonas culicis]|uniref:Thiamine biosynthesis-like protein n=1 Tax=Strigomonas culicis TaxID=28005 RepID=S9UJA8_9TRYP|nr:thiamine biosynthesis-like protein [Strigomonas culicis]|eukprot:EPY30902.1 thiamine biosynthesis-like protein [Strigomonas culicis]